MSWAMQEGDGGGKLVWIDLEMTGLDADADVILEIATLVTDSALRIVAEGPELAIHHDASVLADMDDWNVRHHTASGLLERVRRSEVSVVEDVPALRQHGLAGPAFPDALHADAQRLPALSDHRRFDRQGIGSTVAAGVGRRGSEDQFAPCDGGYPRVRRGTQALPGVVLHRLGAAALPCEGPVDVLAHHG